MLLVSWVGLPVATCRRGCIVPIDRSPRRPVPAWQSGAGAGFPARLGPSLSSSTTYQGSFSLDARSCLSAGRVRAARRLVRVPGSRAQCSALSGTAKGAVRRPSSASDDRTATLCRPEVCRPREGGGPNRRLRVTRSPRHAEAASPSRPRVGGSLVPREDRACRGVSPGGLVVCSLAFLAVTWLILPVVICLSQRLSHACLSMNARTVKLRMAH